MRLNSRKKLLSDREREIAAIKADIQALNQRVILLEAHVFMDKIYHPDPASTDTPSQLVSLQESEPGELVLNDEWKAAIEVLLHGTGHVFVTGVAGSGKSRLLQYITENCEDSFAIVAPTGVAAIRVGGSTIHSMFSFGAHALHEDDVPVLTDSRAAKFKALKLLIIDEGSMVRADLMDAIDTFLQVNGTAKDKSFGGVRVIIFGDLFQLPPVSKDNDEKKWLTQRYGTDTPYLFHSRVWRNSPFKIIQLTTIFRQKDEKFTDALNAIRAGVVSDEQLALLNSRVIPNFVPPADELWITLTTTNASADQTNRRMLGSLNTEKRVFTAEVYGDFNLKDAPTDMELELKVGVVVMFIRNARRGHGTWANGTLGRVTSVSPLRVAVNGEVVGREIEREEWESARYELDSKKNKLTRIIKGGFIQYPLKLAAAVTIHRSQGITLDRVIVDLSSGAFASGQCYVALSRVKTLEGMVLRRPITKRDVIVNSEVQKLFENTSVK